jgi:DNA-binding Lrp family transcriptional regulator
MHEGQSNDGVEGRVSMEKSGSKSKGPVSGAVESAFTKVWGDEHVTALIALKVETAEADAVAAEVARFTEAEDVFLVTGDTDIMVKVTFPHYEELKEFVLHRLPVVKGIRETKTLLVVTAYKEGGEARRS